MPLQVNITKKEENVFTVSCFGSIDQTTHTFLEKEVGKILFPSTKVIIFDMGGVNYVSSMGIGVILKIKKSLEQNKGMLIMTNLQPQVKTVFDIIKALPNEAIFSSIEEADAYLDEIQKKEIEKRQSFDL